MILEYYIQYQRLHTYENGRWFHWNTHHLNCNLSNLHGSPCYNVGCYNYNSTQPYYMVIHLLDPLVSSAKIQETTNQLIMS